MGDGGGHLAGLVLRDGCFVPLRCLFFNTGRIQASSLPQKMGLPADDRGDIKSVGAGQLPAVLVVHGAIREPPHRSRPFQQTR